MEGGDAVELLIFVKAVGGNISLDGWASLGLDTQLAKNKHIPRTSLKQRILFDFIS
jgi:hypothetical protein